MSIHRAAPRPPCRPASARAFWLLTSSTPDFLRPRQGLLVRAKFACRQMQSNCHSCQSHWFSFVPDTRWLPHETSHPRPRETAGRIRAPGCAAMPHASTFRRIATAQNCPHLPALRWPRRPPPRVLEDSPVIWRQVHGVGVSGERPAQSSKGPSARPTESAWCCTVANRIGPPTQKRLPLSGGF